jgi:hypothetical protein
MPLSVFWVKTCVQKKQKILVLVKILRTIICVPKNKKESSRHLKSV